MTYDHVSLALSRLASQFKDSPKLNAMLSSLIAPANDVEGQLDDLANKRWIDTAEGLQLDGLGNIVVEPRQGRSDEEYREAIRFKIFINISKATPPDLLFALKYLSKADDTQYMESWPATVILYTDGYQVQSTIADDMQDLAPAAISDIDVIISYGEEVLRTSNPSMTEDSSSELGGMILPILHTISGMRLQTIDNRAIRIRNSSKVHGAKPVLGGLFEVSHG